MKKRALITGVGGQDGSYLAELLLEKDYEVYGMVRRTSVINFSRIEHLKGRIDIAQADMCDQGSLERLLKSVRPQEVYNLAAQSFVGASFEQPVYTADVTAIGPLRLLEAIRNIDQKIKMYQASSSEMFGNADGEYLNENSPFRPCNPYGAAKVFAHHICQTYRESYGMFVACGILFNHESPRRGHEFVTRKITSTIARIIIGKETELKLGRTDAMRDWGYAGDYVKAMWLMLQAEKPDDFVIATGQAHSVQEFAEAAYAVAGLKPNIRTDFAAIRPTEIRCLRGDASKARDVLKWWPEVNFHGLVKMMVEADCGAELVGRP